VDGTYLLFINQKQATRFSQSCNCYIYPFNLKENTNMAEINTPETDLTGKKILIIKILMVILFVSLAGILVLNLFFKEGSGGRLGGSSVPKEFLVAYRPANFKVDLDEREAIVVLSNPEKYPEAFDKLVFQMNAALIRHVGNRMGLTATQIEAMLVTYRNNFHTQLKDWYFRDFIAAVDTTSHLYQSWYENQAHNAVEKIHIVASKYTCFLMQQLLSEVLQTEAGKFYAKGTTPEDPCGIALTEALQPMMRELEERAAIDDFGRSKGMLEEKVSRVIAELATFEQRDKKGLSQQLQTRFLGMSVSSTDIEISALSIIKTGFKLDQQFELNLNEQSRVVNIVLGEPVVLSHEVYPKIEKMDIGWMRELENMDLNRNINLLREEFRREAIQEDQVLEQAKQQAIELLNTMFLPLIQAFDSRFTLKITFAQPLELKATPKILND